MPNFCEFSQKSEFDKLICTVGNKNQPCMFQRYCSRASEWQNSNGYLNCDRRKTVSRKPNRSFDFIEEKNETIDTEASTNSTTEVVEDYMIKEEKESKIGTVIFADQYSIIVEDENGCGIKKTGFFNVKIGDKIKI